MMKTFHLPTIPLRRKSKGQENLYFKQLVVFIELLIYIFNLLKVIIAESKWMNAYAIY